MTYQDLILRRESCRDYDLNRAVEREKLVACLEAARLAPSACNSQPWKLYAVTERTTLKKVCAAVQGMGMNAFASNCPALIAVVEARPNASERVGARLTKQDFVSVDIGLAVSQLCCEAVEQGLSTCIMGWLDEDKIRAALGIEAARRVRLVIAIGYARSDAVRKKQRKALTEIAEIIE